MLSPAPRFVADGNVGKLARRLRMLGFDTIFAHPVADEELVRIAEREGRVRAVLITRDDTATQVRQILRALDLHPPYAVFSRCLECNEILVPATREEVAGEVPPFVYGTQQSFTRCPKCRRVFWSGTHREQMLRELAAMVGEGWLPSSQQT